MRFKIDENLPRELAQLLIDQGHDAQTVSDEGLGGQNDVHISAVCRKERRALLTLDTGFLKTDQAKIETLNRPGRTGCSAIPPM